MCAYADLSSRKTMARLSSSLNESASDASHLKKSSFARRQLEKMGWSEGTGLGKNRDGMVAHVRAKKREESVGIGGEKKIVEEQSDMWWRDNVGSTLARLQQQKKESKKRRKSGGESSGSDGEEAKRPKKKSRKSRKADKKEKKKSKKKRSKDANGEGGASQQIKVYSDHELFVATGGARFGMRAQRRAEAKWARTESGSKLWEEEIEAKKKIEWNGLGAAKVLLKDGSSGSEGEGNCSSIGKDESDRDSINDEARSQPALESSEKEESSAIKEKKRLKKRKKKIDGGEGDGEFEIKKRKEDKKGKKKKKMKKKD